jgi:hypothetical protein
VAFVNRRLAARGAGGPLALALSGVLLAGHFAAELPASSALLCALGPLLPGLVELLPVRRSPLLGGALRVALALAPALLALWLAYEPEPANAYY